MCALLLVDGLLELGNDSCLAWVRKDSRLADDLAQEKQLFVRRFSSFRMSLDYSIVSSTGGMFLRRNVSSKLAETMATSEKHTRQVCLLKPGNPVAMTRLNVELAQRNPNDTLKDRLA